MEWAYDLGGAPVARLKKFQVAATNTVIGRIYVKNADSGSGIVLGSTTDATDFIGVNIDAAGSYVTAQQSDNSDTQRLTTLSVGPLSVYRARLSGGATDGTALTSRAITTADTTGLTLTHSGYNSSSPTMDDGTVWGYSGANIGQVRKISTVANGSTVVFVAFRYDIASGDTFLFAPISPAGSLAFQATTNCTEIDATAAIASDCEAIVVEMILGDASGNGTTDSYALVQFADNLFGATIT